MFLLLLVHQDSFSFSYSNFEGIYQDCTDEWISDSFCDTGEQHVENENGTKFLRFNRSVDEKRWAARDMTAAGKWKGQMSQLRVLLRCQCCTTVQTQRSSVKFMVR